MSNDAIGKLVGKIAGMEVRETEALPPGTIAFVDPQTYKLLGVITGLLDPAPQPTDQPPSAQTETGCPPPLPASGSSEPNA